MGAAGGGSSPEPLESGGAPGPRGEGGAFEFLQVGRQVATELRQSCDKVAVPLSHCLVLGRRRTPQGCSSRRRERCTLP